MNFSIRELMELLRSNPEIEIDDAYITPSSPLLSPQKGDTFKATEHLLQVAVIAECDRRAATNPLWGYILAIPNGGQRSKAVGGKFKAEGVRAGVPDLFWCVRRHGYGGCFLELKISPNKPSETQREWMDNLRAQGYFCAVIWDSLDEAMTVLEWYIEAK